MDEKDLPYFFTETLATRTQLTDRQNARKFTLQDLNWLDTVFIANSIARNAQEFPMLVEALHLNIPGKPTIELAGAFIMSPAPDGGTFLYTPCRGLEKFESTANAKLELGTWLKAPKQREALLHYLSIAQRTSLGHNGVLTITTEPIIGAVFETQQRTIQHNQQSNAQEMLEQLYLTPSFTSMLDRCINDTLNAHFPDLDQRETRVSSYITEVSQAPDGPRRSTSRLTTTRSLGETVLTYFVDNGWPPGETRQYSNSNRTPTAGQPNFSINDHLYLERSVQNLANGLKEKIKQQLSVFWSSQARTGLSRLEFFSTAMSDKFLTFLLDQQQQALISTKQSIETREFVLATNARSSTKDKSIRAMRILLGEEGRSFIELAGSFIISQTEDPTDIEFLLYTTNAGLKKFSNLQQLKTHMLAVLNSQNPPEEWMSYLSRPQYYSDINLSTSTITTDSFTGAVFPNLINSIIEKQAQNLEYGLDLYRQSKGAINVNALIDQLLDVSSMIAPQLRALNTTWRWSTRPVAFWSPSPTRPQDKQSDLQKAQEKLEILESLNTKIESKLATRPSLHRSATALINTKLSSTRKDSLYAAEISVNTYSSPPTNTESRTPVSSINIVDHFLTRFCLGSDPIASSVNTGLFSDSSIGITTKVPNLTVPALNSIIESALKEYPNYLRRIHNHFPNLQPLLEQAISNGLKAEAELRVLEQSLLPSDLSIILTVLDSYKRDMRPSLNGFRPDAFYLTLNTSEQDDSIALNNCFLLTERGGQDPDFSGKVILWTPALGWETFGSLKTLRGVLNKRLLDPGERITILENLPHPEEHVHRNYTLDSLTLIEEQLTTHQQQEFTQQQIIDIGQLISQKLSVEQLQNIWQSKITKSIVPTNLERAMGIAQAIVLKHSLPEWLGKAPLQDQQLHAELLEQYRNSVEADNDYLQGIDSLPDFTFNKLSALLLSLDSQSSVTPDHIEVTLTAQPEKKLTLVDYALSHRDEQGDETPHFASTGSELLSNNLDAETLKTRIQALNINGTYQDYLRALFSVVTPDLLERQKRFAKQLPWQLMQYAHAQCLKKQLTATAYGYIQQIMDMPDSIARATIAGANAVIRPLELLTTTGAAAIKALGIYLIGPPSGSQGPHVLFAPYSQSHDLKEYTDETSLLTELCSPGPLQDWMLKLLPETARAAMVRFLSPTNSDRLSLQLTSSPITEPLFKRLFTDNLQLLMKLLGCQSIYNAGTHWNLAKDIFKSGIYQGMYFLAGKLAYPLIVWQSYKLFKASADELQDHHWRRAIDHFVKGVAQMALLRQSMPETIEQPSPPPSESVELEQPDATSSEAVTTWPAIDITSHERTQLQPHEVTDLSLHELTKVDSLGLYKSKQNHHYAPVDGKVFQVEKRDEHWHISSPLGEGPSVFKNTRQQWMLSSKGPLLHGRRALSKLSNRFYSSPVARQGMNIQASGMQAIRALYPKQGSMITEALTLATYYAKNANENLRLIAGASPPTTRSLTLIKDFFDLPTIRPEHLREIQYVVKKVFDALTAPSLTSSNSIQFVMGSSRLRPPADTEAVMAFTVVPDTNKIIYLTKEFFKPQLDYSALLIKPFYVKVHARATTLIHELTHHLFATEDIAYLNACHPFFDLIENNTTAGKNARARLEAQQKSGLSLTTPLNELFQVLDLKTWKKVDPDDSHLHHILTLTGGQGLDDARRIFQSDSLKRVKTILNNADSVALLISRLGRQLDPSPNQDDSSR